MKKIIFLLFFFNLCFIYGEDGYNPADKDINSNFVKSIVILPEKILREYDPITIFYPTSKGPKNGGYEDHPEKFVKFDYEQPGDFIWLDDKTLQFKPTIQWAALKKIRWRVENVVRDFYTILNPPTSIIPRNNTENLLELKEITINFSRFIDESDLYSIISLELKELPGIDSKKTTKLTKKDFIIKKVEQENLTSDYKYIIILNKPITVGMKILLNFNLSLLENLSDSKITYQFATKDDFKLSRVGSGNYSYPISVNGSIYTEEQAINGANSNNVFLEFSDQIKSISFSQFKDMIQFSPSVDNLNFTVSGQRIYINGNFQTDKLYEVVINPVFINDINNRMLQMKNKSKIFVYYPGLNSYIRWEKNEGIVELYGPKEFPMTGRNIEKVDLRIYKINPLSRKTWPFPEYPVIIDESKLPPGPGEEPPENEKSFEYIYENELRSHITMLGSPAFSRIIDLPIKKKSGSFNFGLDVDQFLNETWKDNVAGTYLIGYRNLDESKTRNYVKIQVSDLCLSTVEDEKTINCFVTSYKTAIPQSGVEIKIEGYITNNNHKNYKWYDLFSGITDSNGKFTINKSDIYYYYKVKRVVLKKDKDILVLNPNSNLSTFNNNYWAENNENWFSNLYYNELHDTSKIKAFIFTERPIYKPEEPVYIKGYIKRIDKGKIMPYYNNSETKITIHGPSFNKSYPVTISQYDSFDFVFKEDDLATGNYSATIGDGNGNLASVSFSKQAYKIPTFEVLLSGEKKVPIDRPFKVTLTSNYYAGGKVSGERVTWNVTEYPYAYMPNIEKKGYIFSSDSRYNSKLSYFKNNGTIRKEDITDENGTSVLTIDPTLATDNIARRYVFEATVTGADEQSVTTTYDMYGIPSFVLGLKVDRFIKDSYNINPSIIALDVYESNLSDLPVTVRLKRREWHSYLREAPFQNGKPQNITEQVDILIEEKNILTSDGEVNLNFKVPVSGIYLLELEARDKLGRVQYLVTDIYVGGEGAVTWKPTEENLFKTVPNKSSYISGEIASILLQSPVQEAKVLAIIEKPDNVEFKWIDVFDGKATFELPIENYFAPKLPINFILMSPRVYDNGNVMKNQLEDVGKPRTFATTQWLNVSPEENTIKVGLIHPKQSSPGNTIEVELNLTDNNNKPMGGEVTLWLVDQAVLSLGDELPINPLPSFMDQIFSKIKLRDMRNQIIGKLKVIENPGGGGGGDEDYAEKEMRSILESATVRKDFKTIAFYSPSIIVDDTGKKKILIKLPDNLTVFQIRAVVCNKTDRFGFAKSSIEIRLPILVQQSLPRFVRYGDEVVTGGIGRVVVGEGGKGNALIEVDGANINTNNFVDLKWETGVSRKIFFPLKVNSKEYLENGELKNKDLKIKMSISRLSDKATDAFEVNIPIKDDISSVITGYTKEIKKNTPIYFPKIDYKVKKGTMKQELLFTSNIALLNSINALDYQLQYPYGCLEQKISKTYSAIILKQIFDKYGISEISPNIKEYFNETMEMVEKCKTSSGLYSYWINTEGYVYLTSYVLQFLVEAQKSGFNIKQNLIDDAVKALKRSLRSDYQNIISGYEYYERIQALYALSVAGYFDSTYAGELAQATSYYGVEGKGKMLLTLLENNYYNKKLIDSVKKELNDSAIFTLQEGKEIFSGMQDKYSYWNTLINTTEIKSLANVISGLSYNAKYDGRLKLMVDSLVNMGGINGWGDTYTNTHVFIGLRDYLINFKPEKNKYRLNIKYSDKSQNLEIDDKKICYLWKSSFENGNMTLLDEPSSNKKIFVSVKTAYQPDIQCNEIKSLNNGFVIDKEIIIVSKDGKSDIKKQINNINEQLELKLGDIVEEHIQIVNPTDRYFVAIQVPIAAGLEPLNPNLKTSPPEAKPKGIDTKEASYSQFYDDKVNYYFNFLPKGTYNFYFRLKATSEGLFSEPPSLAEMMYKQTVRGTSYGLKVKIKN